MLVPTPGHTAGRMALLVRAGVDEIAGEQVGAVIRRITVRGESLAELVDEAARVGGRIPQTFSVYGPKNAR